MSNKSHYLRRLKLIDKYINRSLNFVNWDKQGMTVDKIIDHVATDATENFFFEMYDTIYIGGEDYDVLVEFMEDYLKKEWRDKINEMLIAVKSGKS